MADEEMLHDGLLEEDEGELAITQARARPAGRLRATQRLTCVRCALLLRRRTAGRSSRASLRPKASFGSSWCAACAAGAATVRAEWLRAYRGESRERCSSRPAASQDSFDEFIQNTMQEIVGKCRTRARVCRRSVMRAGAPGARGEPAV
jgi:hypothetical protein